MKLSSLITFMYPLNSKIWFVTLLSLFFVTSWDSKENLVLYQVDTVRLISCLFLSSFFCRGGGGGGGGVWLEMVSEVPYWLHMGVKEKHFYFYVNNSMQVFIALDMIYFFYLVVWLQCQRSRRPGQLLQHLAHHQLSLAQLHPQTHAQCVRLNR